MMLLLLLIFTISFHLFYTCCAFVLISFKSLEPTVDTGTLKKKLVKMKIGSLLYSFPLYLILGIILLLTQECRGRGTLKQYCLQDKDCMNQYPSDDDTLHSCCDLDYAHDEDWTLYCWLCKYPCYDDKNYCQNQISGASSSWKWVYPSNKDKGTRNGSQISHNLTMSG